MTIRPILIAAVLIGGSLAQGQPQENGEPISICELFKDLRSHAGKIVTVRGLLYSGFEIFALGGRCESKFVTQYTPNPLLPDFRKVPSEFVWPNALDLAISSSVEEGEQTVDYETDRGSITRSTLLIKQEREKLATNKQREVDAWVTVVGKLRLRAAYHLYYAPDGRPRGGGYGHLNTYPGQLVIKVMLDPSVRSRDDDNGKIRPR